MSRPFSKWLEFAKTESPAATALIVNNEPVSYSKFYEQVKAKASSLTAEDAVFGGIYLAEHKTSEEMAILLHSAPLAGCALLPLDPNMPEKSRQAFNENINSKVLFSKSPPDPDAVHLIIATSGTTGVPKGVLLTGNNLAASASASRKRIGLETSDKWLACLPMFHIGGLSILTRCAEARATAVLQEGFNVEAALAAMDDFGITHLSVVPTMLHRFIETLQGKRPPGQLKRVLVGGAALSKGLAKQAIDTGWPLCPTYGMSETSSQCTTIPELPDNWQEGMSGKALDGFEIKLEEKRLKIRGPAVMVGYLNVDRDLGHGLDNGWFKTNDLADIDKNGSVTILGRADDTFIIGGENVHPVSIEHTLSECQGVDDVAVSAIDNTEWGKTLVCVITGPAKEEDVLEFARTCLKGSYLPRFIFKVQALPRNSLGKLDRTVLAQLVSSLQNSHSA